MAKLHGARRAPQVPERGVSVGIAGGACCVGSQDADVRRELLVSVGIEDHVRASPTIPATV